MLAPVLRMKRAMVRIAQKNTLCNVSHATDFGLKDIRADAMDPDAMTGDFSQRLQQMGVVQPNPTYSPSSTAVPHQTSPRPNRPLGHRDPTSTPFKANPILSALEARRRLQHEAEVEFEGLGTSKVKGQRFVNMRTLVDALVLLDRGTPRDEVERGLNLENGLLKRLGGPGILSHESTAS